MQIALDESVRFGMGVDTILQQARGEAFTYSSTSQGTGGQRNGSSLQIINEQQQLIEALDISVSASVRYGVGSVDARMKFAETHALNECSVCVALHAWTTNPPSYAVGRILSPRAEEIYTRDPEEFRRVFGDSYIDEIFTGGSLTILYNYTTQDASSSSELSASLHGAFDGLVVGADLSASFAQSTKEWSGKSRLEISAFISGGRGVVNPKSIEESLWLYENFSSLVLNAGVPYFVTAKPWHEFPLPRGASWVEGSVRTNTIETAGKYVLQGIQDRSKIEYILRNPEQFVEPDTQALRNSMRELLGLQNKWGRAAAECNDALDACDLQGLEYPAVTWPERIQTLDPLEGKFNEVKHDPRAATWFIDMGSSESFAKEYFTDKQKRGRWRLSYSDRVPCGGIYWTESTGAHVVYGGIFLRYQELHGPEGRLGYPITDEEYFDSSLYPDRLGDRCQRFQNGVLWWDAQTAKVMDDFSTLPDGSREWPRVVVDSKIQIAPSVKLLNIQQLPVRRLGKRN